MAVSLLTRPVVSAISEMHAAAHPELAAHGAGEHSHGDAADDADAGRTSDEGQPEHTDGLHGLMHQASGGAFDRGVAALEILRQLSESCCWKKALNYRMAVSQKDLDMQFLSSRHFEVLSFARS